MRVTGRKDGEEERQGESESGGQERERKEPRVTTRQSNNA